MVDFIPSSPAQSAQSAQSASSGDAGSAALGGRQVEVVQARSARPMLSGPSASNQNQSSKKSLDQRSITTVQGRPVVGRIAKFGLAVATGALIHSEIKSANAAPVPTFAIPHRDNSTEKANWKNSFETLLPPQTHKYSAIAESVTGNLAQATDSKQSSSNGPNPVLKMALATGAATATAVIASALNGDLKAALPDNLDISRHVAEGSEKLLTAARDLESKGVFGKNLTLETDFIVEITQSAEKDQKITPMQQGFARLGLNLALTKGDDGKFKIDPTIQLKTHLISGGAVNHENSSVTELASWQISSINIPLNGDNATETRFIGPLIDWNKSGSSPETVAEVLEEAESEAIQNLVEGTNESNAPDLSAVSTVRAALTAVGEKIKPVLSTVKAQGELGFAAGFRTKVDLGKITASGKLPEYIALKLATNTLPALAGPAAAALISRAGGGSSRAADIAILTVQALSQAISLSGTIGSAAMADNSDALKSVDFQTFTYPYVAATGVKLPGSGSGSAEATNNAQSEPPSMTGVTFDSDVNAQNETDSNGVNYGARLPRARWDVISLNYSTSVKDFENS